jgi:tetratricopeptide (TPR) repeat protein
VFVLVLISLAVLCTSAFGQTTAEDWFNQGVKLLKHYDTIGNADKAFDEAIKLNPNYAEAWYYKGLGLYGRNDDEPKKAFDEAFRLDPNNAEMWFNYGTFLNSYYDSEEAAKAFDEVIRLDPNNASAWDGKGQALNYQGIHYTSTNNPLNGANARDKSAYDQGKLNEALAAFDEAIRLNPNYAAAYDQKASVLDELGRETEADAVRYGTRGNTG